MFNFLSQRAEARRLSSKTFIERSSEQMRAWREQQLIADAAMRQTGAHIVIIRADGTIIPVASKV
jgi:hypothetical protein